MVSIDKKNDFLFIDKGSNDREKNIHLLSLQKEVIWKEKKKNEQRGKNHLSVSRQSERMDPQSPSYDTQETGAHLIPLTQNYTQFS